MAFCLCTPPLEIRFYCCRSPLSVEKRAVIKKILVIINEKVGKRAKRTRRAREKSAENERVQHHTPENGKKGSIQPPRTQKRAASNPRERKKGQHPTPRNAKKGSIQPPETHLETQGRTAVSLFQKARWWKVLGLVFLPGIFNELDKSNTCNFLEKSAL